MQKLLGSEDLTPDQWFVTSRKSPNSNPPGPKSTSAWRHIKNSDFSEQVVRSPLNWNDWITPYERKIILMKHSQDGKPFKTKNGWELVLEPRPGQIVWIKIAQVHRRVARIYQGGKLIPYRDHHYFLSR